MIIKNILKIINNQSLAEQCSFHCFSTAASLASLPTDLLLFWLKHKFSEVLQTCFYTYLHTGCKNINLNAQRLDLFGKKGLVTFYSFKSIILLYLLSKGLNDKDKPLIFLISPLPNPLFLYHPNSFRFLVFVKANAQLNLRAKVLR